jgi:hypothetical protein
MGLDMRCKSFLIFNDFFTENFGGIGTCLWCCWKDLDEQDLMELFGKIWIQNVGDIDFLSDFCH